MGDAAAGAIWLREGGAGDLEAMYGLDVRCFEPQFRFSRRAMGRFAGTPGSVVLIAGAGDGGMAGFVMVQMEVRGGETLAYVVTLDVAPELRRQGIAHRLLGAAEAEAIRRSAVRMTLHVWTENAAAIRLYEEGGYMRAGFDPDFYGPGTGAYAYELPLASPTPPPGSLG